MEIHSAGNLGPRVQVHFPGPSRTKQASKNETDINWIMKKYLKTGLIDHFAKHGAEYGFASSVTFHEAMNVIRKADQMFDDLPAEVRRRFDGDPGGFLEFVQNPENQEEMVELGLSHRSAVVEREPVEVVPEAPAAPITPEVIPDAGVVDPAV